MQNIVTVFASIPDVIWAAIIASGLTFLGVTLSNRANRKCLLLQLNHAAQQKDKERELQIRKEVYIEAAEAIAESIKDIMFLPNRIIFSDKLEMSASMLPAIAKIHMVGTFETIISTTEWMKKFNQSTLPLTPELSKYFILKQELASLNSLGKSKVDFMKEINKRFEVMDSESKQNPDALNNYKDTFKKAQTEYDSIVNQSIEKEKQLREQHAKLLGLCIQAGTYLQKEALFVTLAIRKELHLEIDSDEYISAMDKAFNSSNDALLAERIKKMIYDNK